jgi:hypothetical protein
MSRFIMASVVVVGLAMVAPLANAQTGPAGGGNGTAGNGGMTQPGIGSRMTPDMLEQYLKQQGYQTKINNLSNGDIVVAVEIQKDGWRFKIEFMFTNKGAVIEVNVPLTPISQLSSQQGMALLKYGYEKYPLHFSLRPNGNVLTLECGSCLATGLTVQQLPVVIDAAIRTARETYNIWNPANWTSTGGMAQK